jgi:hypothetical protein
MGAIAISVSILALLVSAATCLFTYRQTKAARAQANAALRQAKAASDSLEIEQNRWLAERTPNLFGAIHFVSPSAHQLELGMRNGQSVTVTELRFEDTDIIDFAEDENNAQSLRSLDSATPIRRWVRVNDSHPDVVRLQVTCEGTRPSDRWVVPVEVLVFPELRKRQPRFVSKLMREYPAPPYVELELKTAEKIAFLEATITTGYGIRFLRGGGQLAITARSDELVPGGRTRWPVAIDRSHSEVIGITVICRGEKGESWKVTESIGVPSSVARPGKPKFKMEIVKDGSQLFLELRLLSQWPLESLEVAIDSDMGVKFLHSDGRSGGIKAGHRQLEPNKAIRWPLDLGQWMTMFFEIDVTCTGPGDEKWRHHQMIDVPAKYQSSPPSPD